MTSLVQLRQHRYLRCAPSLIALLRRTVGLRTALMDKNKVMCPSDLLLLPPKNTIDCLGQNNRLYRPTRTIV